MNQHLPCVQEFLWTAGFIAVSPAGTPQRRSGPTQEHWASMLHQLGRLQALQLSSLWWATAERLNASD
jgi:hypothetical protein